MFFSKSLTCVVGVHDTSVVEHDVETTPRVDLLDGGSNIGLLADIADSGLNLASSVGNDLLDLGDGLLESRCRDVAHQDGGTLAGEENGGLKTNATDPISVRILSMTHAFDEDW